MKRLICLLLLLVVPFSVHAENIIPPAYEVPDYVTWLLDVARGELGYTETASGYTKYGEWAGDSFAQWCAEFQCWCVNQVDEIYGTGLLNTVYPMYSGTNTGKNWFLARGRYISRTGFIDGWGSQWLWNEEELLEKNAYIPQPGDWAFFTFTGGTDTDHVALVEYCTREDDGSVAVHLIEGNDPDKVQRHVYPLTSSQILGFGTVRDSVGTTMRSGCEGLIVEELEKKLHYLGLMSDTYLDQHWGPDTTNAVKAFQQTMTDKLVNGLADRRTQTELALAYDSALFNDPLTWLVTEENVGGNANGN